MKIVINIKTDSSAFKESVYELQDILVDVAEHIAQSNEKERVLYDSNGNEVGKFKVTGK
jgi:hypothetical protein